jgi:hypothetical protein
MRDAYDPYLVADWAEDDAPVAGAHAKTPFPIVLHRLGPAHLGPFEKSSRDFPHAYLDIHRQSLELPLRIGRDNQSHDD